MAGGARGRAYSPAAGSGADLRHGQSRDDEDVPRRAGALCSARKDRALLLGCERAAGCDIDPKAPEVAEANAALNGIGKDRFAVYAGDVLTDAGMRKLLGGGYDIVTANIVADVIIPLSAIVRPFLKADGVFLTSGIIEGRQDEVQAALEKNGFTVVNHRCEEEWHCFECRA